jgi:hypothetical protein
MICSANSGAGVCDADVTLGADEGIAEADEGIAVVWLLELEADERCAAFRFSALVKTLLCSGFPDCLASMSRCKSAGSSKFALPVAFRTTAALFCVFWMREKRNSLRPLCTMAFGALSHAPRQPDVRTLHWP